MRKCILFALAALALVCSCEKKKEEPLQVQVATGAATSVGTDKATLNGRVLVSGAALSEVRVFSDTVPQRAP